MLMNFDRGERSQPPEKHESLLRLYNKPAEKTKYIAKSTVNRENGGFGLSKRNPSPKMQSSKTPDMANMMNLSKTWWAP